MRDLTSFLEIPFDDPDIGIPKLMAFGTDNLQRMVANNPGGELDTRITATMNSLGLVETHGADDETKLNLRKARKKAKDTFRAALPAKIGRLAAAVTLKYGADSTEFTECFGMGRTVFSTSADDDLKKHLVAVQTGITALATGLGAPIVAEADALVSGWTAIHAASESASGAKTSTQEAKKYARENLQLMLFLNLLKFAEMFPRQPEKLSLYMTQSLLESRPSEPGTPASPTPPPTS